MAPYYNIFTKTKKTQENKSIKENDSDTSTITNEPGSARHREEIKNPQTAIVQKEIKRNTTKILVEFQSGVQSFVSFEIPKEECTVLDLMEELKNQV